MNLRENEIIIALKQGDKNALEALYKNYFVSLCTYAAELTGNIAAAEDIVSELYCFLWEHRKQIIIKESLKSYLFRAVRNRCLNHLKHQKTIQKYITESKSMEAQVDEINLEYLKKNRELENIDISERIIKAVDKLPDQARVIFKLKRQEGRTYDEIAKELNISINTVRKQMSRALTKLRQELADLLKNNESRMG